MSENNGSYVYATGQPSALKMALWLIKNGYHPIPLNEFGIIIGKWPDGTDKLGEGKEPHRELADDWGKTIWTPDSITDFYERHPLAGIGALLDIWCDFDCDGPGAKELLLELLSPDVPDTYGWMASLGEHHAYLKDGRVVDLCTWCGSNRPKIGNLECRLNGEGKLLQSALPPTLTNIGTKREPRPGPPRYRLGSARMAHLPACFFDNFKRAWEAQEGPRRPRKLPRPEPCRNGHHGPSEAATGDLDALTPDKEARVAKYLAKCKEAVSGAGGHDDAFDTAIKLRCRFPITREVGFDMFIRYYNPLCDPGWEDKDVWHKINDAWDRHPYDPKHTDPFAEDEEPASDRNGKIGHERRADRDIKRWESYKSITFGAVAGKIGKMKFLWENWLVTGNINMICSKPKYGKTRFYLALAKCLWEGTEWPDGQANTNPPGSKMLVAPYDRNHVEIAAEMEVMGIPDEAIYCAHDPEDELLVPDLATPDMMKAIDWYATHDPAIKMVVIDTLTYASSTPLFKPEDMKKLLDPLMQMAAKHGLTVLVLIHENREGLALGNRITERARVLMQLERYSEADPTKLRLYVKDSNFPGRPAITVIHDNDGLKFGRDEGPIQTKNGGRRGPDPIKSSRFAEWLKHQLDAGPRQIHDLVRLARLDGLMADKTAENPEPSISPLYAAMEQIPRLYPGFQVEPEEKMIEMGKMRKFWVLYGPNDAKPENAPEAGPF